MTVCCITGFGKKIRREKGLVVIDPARGEQEQIRKTIVNPSDLSLVVISGDHDLTTSAIRSFLDNGAEMVLLDRFGSPSGYLLPCGKSAIIENAEKQRKIPATRALEIAREIIMSAVRNKISLLRGAMKNRPEKNQELLTTLEGYRAKFGSAKSVHELFGIEGMATRLYYSGFGEVIPSEFGFKGRNRNPPRDPVNAMLSYGYGVLYGVIRTALVKTGLSPFYGVLHADYRHQEPLVYDFIEEFRQPIVDRVVMTLINHHQVCPEQFTLTPGGCIILDDLRRSYAREILGRLETPYEYGGSPRPFQEIIAAQARFLADALLEGKKYRAFVYR